MVAVPFTVSCDVNLGFRDDVIIRICRTSKEMQCADIICFSIRKLISVFYEWE